ncbi:hypothetical protein P5706_28375 [Pseudomonas sp. ChxA]|uniref:hypothetical protein n=1 Tax=Pseudomonas sp. ChxA TaxID=3035473 RepID=UPI0025553DEE|nr:hypothetical protein [Pseudomonas sp. ChxA]MDL2188107.1 hypothetical protein [Pseudomonas sp. ChxA]
MAEQPKYTSIITAKEIEVIKEYISLATQLRADYDRMKGGAAFITLSGQVGLSTALDEQGVNQLIDAVLDHAGKWTGIEVSMRALCQEVFTYSDHFTAGRDAIVGQITSLPGYSNASEKLTALPEKDWEGVTIPLGDEDLTLVPSIKKTINEMVEELASLKITGGELRDEILSFKTELMNTIQTALRRITALDTVHELEQELSRVAMSEHDRLTVRGHMHNVTSAFADVVAQSYILDGKIPNTDLIDFYKSDYEAILRGLSSSNAETIRALLLKMRSGAVLTQHFSAFHDALERLHTPLELADKGVGQLRTLWTLTLDVMQSAQDRTLQVTSFSLIKRIEKSLDSAAFQWRAARGNAEDLNKLLTVLS